MKICIVSSGWVPIVPGKGVLYGGGIESQVYGVAKALTKLCDEVHLITIVSEVSAVAKISEGVLYHKIVLPFKNPPSESTLKLGYCDLLFAYESRVKHNELDVDLVHCNTKFPAVAALLNRSNKPIVFTAHNWKLWEGFKPEWKSPFARFAYVLDTRLERYIATRSDRVLALSRAMKRGIVESTGISTESVDVVPNAVDAGLFSPEDVERTSSILYVGRITAEKGIDILVRAMPLIIKEIHDVQLIIVGPRKYGLERGGFAEKIQQLIKRLNIEERVIFAGTVAISELIKIYSQATVLCLPAVWQEPFGLVLIEAMACETPVVGTCVGGIPEVISESQAGLLARPRDVRELAQAIVQILADSKLARRLGRNGRRAVLEKYTFDRVAQQVYPIYADILK